MRPQGARGWIVAAGASMALLVTGCVSRREPPRPEPRPEAVRPSERPDPGPPTLIPRDEARNKVAVLVPLNGPNAGVGTSIANAANLALLDSGNAGIRITVYDTASGAAVAANAALTDGNRLFLGPLLAEDVRAVAPIARRGGVPVIAFSNDVGVAGDSTYIMGFTPGQSIERIVSHARGEGTQRFAALVPDGIYGQRAGQALLDAVGDAGGRVAGLEKFNRAPASLANAARSLGGKGGYDALLIADSALIAANAANLMRPSARGARILGTELWGTDRAIGRHAALRGARFAAVPDLRFDQLAARYRARYQRTPYRLASLGYDAVLLAVRINRDWDIGSRFPERLLIARDGFSGVDGPFRFRRDGTAERMLAVHEVTSGGTRIVSPAPAGFGD